MSNKFENIILKNHTYYFFGDVIIVRSFDPNIKINKKSYKNILIY